MVKNLAVVCSSFFLIACSAPEPKSSSNIYRLYFSNIINEFSEVTESFLKSNTEVDAINSAQKYIKLSLKDPNSAQFQNVRVAVYESRKIICGEVNAKNSYGGYVGFKRFVSSPYKSETERTDGTQPEVDNLLNNKIKLVCGYNY